MSERPRDNSGEGGRTGPLGDWETSRQDDSPRDERTKYDRAREEQTRETPQDDAEETRRIPAESRRENSDDEAPTRFAPNDAAQPSDEERRTRLIPSTTPEEEAREAYPRGYFEAAEERHERLREMYGGVDWLASFLGFLFAGIAGAFLSVVGGIVLIPLGFSPDLGGFGAATVTALVLAGVLIFLTYFCGGYVAGRLARFDGGRNGLMVVAWAVVVSFLSFAVFGFLPGAFSDLIRSLTQDRLLPALVGLQNLGLAGAAIIAAALALALLGGFVGGRAGSRYHRDIDRTT